MCFRNVVILLLCLVTPVYLCDHLVGEERTSSCVWSVACVLSVIVCFVFLLMLLVAMFCDRGSSGTTSIPFFTDACVFPHDTTQNIWLVCAECIHVCRHACQLALQSL